MTESFRHSLDKKEVGLRIRAIRGERTQKEFAEITGATQSYISDLERGKCFPSVSFLGLLVELSGKTYDWILTGREGLELLVVEPEEEPEEVPEEVPEEELEEEKRAPPPPPVPADMDYIYLQNLIIFLRDAPPSEKPRFLRILISYLLTYT